jgi:AcrR family transcriptional regulator
VTSNTTTESSEERIIRAATACFARWGVAKTSMGDIAAAAGMLRPHLYRHFESKEALITTVIVRESRALGQERLRMFPRRGRASSFFLKALMYGQERLATNEFANYVAQDGSGLLVRLLATDSAFLESEGLWWNPALDYGRDRGEVREDLSNAEIIRWFLLSQMTVFERRDLWPNEDELRRHLERFVIAAIATRSSPQPDYGM